MSSRRSYDDEDEDDDPCFCGCCCPLLKCSWNNGWRIILVACAVGVAVVLALCCWLFILSLRSEPKPDSPRWWVSYVAPLFFVLVACLACVCGGCIWVLLCPAKKRKKRRVWQAGPD
jgi:hypothetical protein